MLKIPVLILFSFVSLSAGLLVCEGQPKINKNIIVFVKSKINKKVGTGECWDLAAEALDKVGAKWNHDLEFGTKVDPTKGACIYPGDIIQFENVEMIYQEKNTFFTQNLLHHTAVIYEVKKNGTYVIAQQNTSDHGKKVSLDPLDLSWIKKGSYIIYRPHN